jgi:hypothetical protein
MIISGNMLNRAGMKSYCMPKNPVTMFFYGIKQLLNGLLIMYRAITSTVYGCMTIVA